MDIIAGLLHRASTCAHPTPPPHKIVFSPSLSVT